jgi:hypothetical protein
VNDMSHGIYRLCGCQLAMVIAGYAESRVIKLAGKRDFECF